MYYCKTIYIVVFEIDLIWPLDYINNYSAAAAVKNSCIYCTAMFAA